VAIRGEGATEKVDKTPLADAELAVMQFLWEEGEQTARQIRESLYGDDTASNNATVQKLLARLEQKGFVERDRSQFVHSFLPSVSRPQYANRQLESLAAKLTGGSLVPLISHLVEGKKLSPQERREIRDLLDRFGSP
jgi:BlaI family transcriptional regulator, penicillinase repressor